MIKKRESLEIIKDILQLVKDERQIKPTNIMFKANLSPQMFKKYFNELLEKDLLKIIFDERNKKFIVMTKKADNFLIKYKKFERFLEEFNLLK